MKILHNIAVVLSHAVPHFTCIFIIYNMQDLKPEIVTAKGNDFKIKIIKLTFWRCDFLMSCNTQASSSMLQHFNTFRLFMPVNKRMERSEKCVSCFKASQPASQQASILVAAIYLFISIGLAFTRIRGDCLLIHVGWYFAALQFSNNMCENASISGHSLLS